MKSDRINITFVLPNLMAGGAERVISYIAQNIDPTKFSATLLIVGYSKDASYDAKNINVVFLEKSRVVTGIPALFSYVWKNKPDILVSAIGHLNTVTAYMSLIFPKTKFVAREVTVLSLDAAFFDSNINGVFAFLANRRFRFFDKIICQSVDMLEDIQSHSQIDKNKFAVINNPITDGFKLKEQTEKNDPIQYITVGRLSREKGIDRLLKVLSQLDFPFHYTIIGNGPEKKNLFSLIDKYNLKSNITHVDFTKDVSKYLANSDLFLQGSHFEGFPNCLLESCSVGTPVLAFTAPGGTKEIVENGVNGYIVETEEAFIEKLKMQRQWNPEKIRESVHKKFNKELIIRKYEELFTEIVEKKRR